jgi:type II secretory pathway pseudopilin PulG
LIVALVVVGLLLAGFAGGWVCGIAYGVRQEAERQQDAFAMIERLRRRGRLPGAD